VKLGKPTEPVQAIGHVSAKRVVPQPSCAALSDGSVHARWSALRVEGNLATTCSFRFRIVRGDLPLSVARAPMGV